MKGNKLLVIIDMQGDFIDGSLGTKEAEAIVPKVVEYAENYNGYIVMTKDTHFNDYLSTQEGSKLPIPHCIINTEGWMICEELSNVEYHSEMVISKSGFGSSQLIDWIKSNKFITEIDIVGLCTDICVIVNAFAIKTFFPETKIRVHKDLCAGTTPENHKKALDVMKICQIDIV